MTTINVPERNRAIKRLLKAAFPCINIRVMAGKGTAYHWVYISFGRRPDPMPAADVGDRFTDHIAGLIGAAGIALSNFPASDDGTGGMLPCLVVDLPRVQP